MAPPALASTKCFFSAASKSGAVTPQAFCQTSCDELDPQARHCSSDDVWPLFRRDARYCARYWPGPPVCSRVEDPLAKLEIAHWPQSKAIDEQLAQKLEAAQGELAADVSSDDEDRVLPLASHAFRPR